MRSYQPPRNVTLYEEGRYWQEFLATEEKDLESRLRARVAPMPIIIPVGALPAYPGRKILPRNVYIAPFLTARGELVLFAVDRRGRCRAKAIVHDMMTWEDTEQGLWGILDGIDPDPKLTLMKTG